MTAKVAWFTGLSGSGKTAIAAAVAHALKEQGKRVLVLDGDEIRAKLHRHLGFTPEDIRENNQLIAELCLKEQPHYHAILVPIISPFRASRAAARAILTPDFIEVHVRASLDTVKRRDPKGLYCKVEAGELKGFIGVEVPYESPENPEIVIDTEFQDLYISSQILFDFLIQRLA